MKFLNSERNIGKIRRFIYLDMLSGTRIKSIKGKYYFVKSEKRFKIGIFISIFVLIGFAAGWNIVNAVIGEDIKNNIIENIKTEYKEKTQNKEFTIDNKIKITMPECMTFLEDKHDDNGLFETYYYQYVTNNTEKTDLQTIQFFYYDNYNIKDYFNDYETFTKEISNAMFKYGILNSGMIDIEGQKVFYLVLDDMDQGRTSVGYYLNFDNVMIEVYTHFKKDNYQVNTKKMSDDIISSIKIVNNKI